MKILLAEFPCRRRPKNVIYVNDGLAIFPSKKQVINPKGLYANCIGLALKIDSQIDADKVLSDFIVTLNLFGQEYPSIIWLSELDSKEIIIDTSEGFSKVVTEKTDTDTMNDFINVDFNRLHVQILVVNRFHYSFTDVFKAIINLNHDSFDYQCLKYFSIINPIVMITNKVYRNELMENALIFPILESIILTYHNFGMRKDKRQNSIIEKIRLWLLKKLASPNWKVSPTENIGLNTKIKLFLTHIGVKDSDVYDLIVAVGTSRHAFFHSLNDEGYKKSFTEYIKKTNVIDNKADSKKIGYGTVRGKYVLKSIIILYIFDRLAIKEIM